MNLEDIKVLAYNKKQIFTAENELRLFHQGRTLLCELGNELSYIIENLQKISDEARQSLLRCVSRLEMAYAFAEAEERDFTAEDWEEINENIAVIQAFFAAYKKQYQLDDFDEEYEEYKFLYPDDK